MAVTARAAGSRTAPWSAHQRGAAAVDSSDDPSIAAFRASAEPFLARPGEDATVVTHVYSIGRR